MKGPPKLTQEIAWAAAKDAADHHMRKAGRSTWIQEDFNVARRAFDRLWPPERDMESEKTP